MPPVVLGCCCQVATHSHRATQPKASCPLCVRSNCLVLTRAAHKPVPRALQAAAPSLCRQPKMLRRVVCGGKAAKTPFLLHAKRDTLHWHCSRRASSRTRPNARKPRAAQNHLSVAKPHANSLHQAPTVWSNLHRLPFLLECLQRTQCSIFFEQGFAHNLPQTQFPPAPIRQAPNRPFAALE